MTPLLLHELLLATAARYPRRVAVSRDGEALTFAEIAEKTKRLARALAAAGLGRGDRLAWWGGTELDLVPLFFAVASLGAVYTPIDPRLNADEARTIVDLTDPRLIVVDDQHDGGPRLRDLVHSTVTGGFDTPAVAETDGHVLFLTSGSTGAPKAIVLSHRTSVLRALSTLADFPGGPLVSMFPLFHMAGWSSALSPWVRGEQVVFADGGDAERLASAIEASQASRFYAIPAVWHRILSLDLSRHDLSSLRFADTGTSATTVELLTAIHEALPRSTTTVTYGSTEAGAVCRLPFEDLQRKPGSAGPPVPCAQIHIENGELLVKSPFLFDGYLADPAATREAIVDGWYRTGDLAAIDDEGYVSILGRVKDVIRSGGETISPVEVDLVLLDHPAALDAAAAGVPDDSWGEIVTAFVVPRPGSSITLEELQRHCEARLARYKVPRRLVLVDAIPRTGATRQVQRRRLVQEGVRRG